MKNNLLSFFLLAAMFSACAKNDYATNGNDTAYDPSKIVCFTAGVETRGTPVSSESEMSSIGVFCAYTADSDWDDTAPLSKMFNERLNRNAIGKWEYIGAPVYWDPTSIDDRYTFFVYSPYESGVYNASTNATGNGIEVTTSKTTGIPEIIYTVPENCANQPDLMVAAPSQNIRPTVLPVAVDMKHALTCVGFTITNDTGSGTITGIKVKGVSLKGTLKMGGGTNDEPVWDNLDTPSSAEFSALLETVTTDQVTTRSNGHLMMIPQTLSADATLIITFDYGGQREVKLNSHHWEMGKKLDYQIIVTKQGTIILTPKELHLPHTQVNHISDNISIECYDLTGAPSSTVQWTLTSNASWLKLSPNSDGSDAAQTISGAGSQIIHTVATSTTNTRYTTISLNGISETNVTQVKQIDISSITDIGAAPGTTYVGAFWKNDEMGERLIRISANTYSGDWAARVAWKDAQWADGDIVLDVLNLPTYPAGFVATGSDTPAVSGDQSTVGGTVAANQNIYFRVGLKSRFTPTLSKPARYAIVAIHYNNYNRTQLLYIRQGENADVISGTTVRWSVYNSRPTSFANTIAAQAPIIPTNYPSQAGGYKQFNSTTGFYSPTDPRTPGTAWLGSSDTSVGTDINSCPDGYRYRVPVSSEATVLLSSKRIDGYYADGYFDRGSITNGNSVSSGNDIAYIGTLYLNPSTKAAIFLPKIGRRGNATANINDLGSQGFYWTNTAASSSNGYNWSDIINIYNTSKSTGSGIRCILKVGLDVPTDGNYNPW